MGVDDFDKWLPMNVFTNIQTLIIFKKPLEGWVNRDGSAFNDVGGIYCLVDFQKWNDDAGLVRSEIDFFVHRVWNSAHQQKGDEGLYYLMTIVMKNHLKFSISLMNDYTILY